MRIIIFIFFILICSKGHTQQDIADTIDNKVAIDTSIVSDSVKTYSVNLLSLPENAEVYSDTVLIGHTPLIDIKLKEGEHALKFINPRSGKYWQNSNETIKFDLRSDSTFSVNFKYFYYFETEPFNASVISSDTLMGHTPLRIFTEFKLTDNIIFRKNNYYDFVFNISDYNSETGAKVKMKSKGKVSLNEGVYKNKGTQFNSQRNLPAIIGLGLASVSAAYFTYDFKSEGNKAYDEYLLTGNQSKLDESSSQDTYFIISLLVMQAALGGLVYFLFFD